MKPLAIPTGPLEHHAMDYTFLRQEGIRYLQEVAKAGLRWTDFNAHDPGITILEQLCYAITDLGYRIAYELPDLLANDGGDPYESLYNPARILTSHPVTLTDLRKLVLDVEGVKNVWIEKVEEPEIPLNYHAQNNELSLQDNSLETEPVHLKGLYRVLFEKSVTDIDGTDVKRDVIHRLHANRNLCEDFEKIELLKKQPIRIQARVEIGPVEDAKDVLLRIYENISDYISPSASFSTLKQMQEKGKPIDEIFEGPRLEHGFIYSEAMQQLERRTTIYTSDLIHEIMAVNGVRAVNDIKLSSGTVTEAWSFKVATDLAPRLDIANSTITLERAQLTVAEDKLKEIEINDERLKSLTAFQTLALKDRDIVPPIGHDRKVGNYYSIQHQFPATYGIGAMGLPASASPQRRAQAKQLKAYLMFFDQLLANYFSQLAHVRDLFSFHRESARTYFAQSIEDSSLGLEDIRDSNPVARQTRLQQITEKPHTEKKGAEVKSDSCRRNRFLNHLLARFAEQFTDYSLILYGVFDETIPVAEQMAQVAQDKQNFLQNYPRLSSARGTAFNYLKSRSNENRSGLEERIRAKLGLMDEEEDFFLVEHILLRPMESDKGQKIPILADPQVRDPYSLQISFVFRNWPSKFAESGFRAFIERTVREETPAHLISTIHWLDRDAWKDCKDTYHEWLDKRRDYWKGKLGI
ncbi:hypothetical protein ACFL5F_01860 [Planctomycetota bacterium]